jgi:beta-lactam-binding protein with PASTA domain
MLNPRAVHSLKIGFIITINLSKNKSYYQSKRVNELYVTDAQMLLKKDFVPTF